VYGPKLAVVFIEPLERTLPPRREDYGHIWLRGTVSQIQAREALVKEFEATNGLQHTERRLRYLFLPSTMATLDNSFNDSKRFQAIHKLLTLNCVAQTLGFVAQNRAQEAL
jgi:hypothetical protein